MSRFRFSALARLPDLRVDPISVFASPNSMVIRYRNERGQEVCEYPRFDANSLIVQGAAHTRDAGGEALARGIGGGGLRGAREGCLGHPHALVGRGLPPAMVGERFGRRAGRVEPAFAGDGEAEQE